MSQSNNDAPRHDWETDVDGELDTFAFSEGYHNGPRCKACGAEFCHHCTPDCYAQACPSPPAKTDEEQP